MPIVPRGNQAIGMNVGSPVPIAGTDQARSQGETLEKAGTAVAAFASQQIQFDNRVSYEEGAGELTDIAKQGADWAKRNGKPDGSDYTQKYNEFTQPKMADAINRRSGFGTGKVQEQLISYRDRVQADMNTSIGIQSLERREIYNIERTDKLQDESANRVRANPRSADAELALNNSFIDDLTKPGKDGSTIISSANAIKLKQAYYEKTAKSMIAGFAEREQYGQALNMLQATQKLDKQGKPLTASIDPDKAVTLGYIDSREAAALKSEGKMLEIPALSKGDNIKLTNAQALILSGLDPKEKAHLIDVMQAKVREKTEIKISDLNAGVTGFEAVAFSGAAVNPAQIADLKKQVNGNSSLTPLAKVRTMDRINTAAAVNQQLQLAAITPRSQWGDITQGVTEKITAAATQAATIDPKMGTVNEDFAVRANRMQAAQTFSSALANIKKQQDSDPVSYFLMSDESLRTKYMAGKDASTNPQGIEATRNFMTTMLNKQAYVGIPVDKQKVLTTQESTAMANMLVAIPDSANTNQELTRLQATYGEHFPRVLNELAQRNKALTDFKAIAYVDPSTREHLVDALKNESTIMTEYTGKNATKDNQKKNQLVIGATKDIMAGFRTATVGSTNDTGRLAVVQSLEKLVGLQARSEMLRDGSLSEKQAVARAYKDVVDSTYAVVDAGKSSLLVPRIISRRPMDTTIVRDYVDVYSKAPNFKDLNVAVPAQYTESHKVEKTGNIAADNDQKFMAQRRANEEYSTFYDVLQKNARWVTNENQTGIKLVQNTENGNVMSVYDKFGKPIEKSYEEINLRPGQKVIDQNKTKAQRLFGD